MHTKLGFWSVMKLGGDKLIRSWIPHSVFFVYGSRTIAYSALSQNQLIHLSFKALLYFLLLRIGLCVTFHLGSRIYSQDVLVMTSLLQDPAKIQVFFWWTLTFFWSFRISTWSRAPQYTDFELISEHILLYLMARGDRVCASSVKSFIPPVKCP